VSIHTIARWSTASALALLGAALACGPSRGGRDLVVTSYSPTEGRDEAGPIQIQFDRPVVGEDEVGKSLDVPPVDLQPAATVRAHWSDRQTLVLTPQGELAPSTRYQVVLREPLASRTGGFSFAFVNQPLKVDGVFGVDLARLPPKPELPVQFNQPVAVDQVAAHCRIQAASGDASVALSAQGGGTATKVTVIPATALDQGKPYTLVCDGLSGAGGDAPLAEPWIAELHTYPAFAVNGATPSGWDVPADDAEVDITFANPVNLDQVRRAVSIQPLVAGFDLGALDKSGTHYKVVVNLATETDYTIRVASGLRDIYDQPLAGDWTHDFHAGDAQPRLTVETGIFAVEPSGDGYPVWTRNLRKFQVTCAAVPKDKVVKVLTSGMDYDPWYDAEDSELDWKEMGLRSADRTLTVANAKNKWQLTNLALESVCGGKVGKDKRGLYLASLAADDVKMDDDHPWRYHPDRRVLANVTDLGILLQAGTASGLVWVTRLSTGKPVGGAQVSVYSPQGALVFSGRSNGDGIVRLPGTSKLLAKTTKDDTDPDDEEDWEEMDDYRSQRLIAVVEHDGDLGVVDGNWANGIQVWNFGVDSDREGGLARIRGFIQSDRGIYRPGETVHFKGIVREIAVGKTPRVPAKAKVHLEVENSRGAVVYTDKLALSRFGGFHFDFALGDEAETGDYYVRAKINDQTFHERFMVEEFRKVTYEVGLSSAEKQIRVGDKLAFDVKADYLFGAPVAGASVEWNLQRRPHDVSFAGYQQYEFSDYASRGWDWWESRYGDSYLSYISDGTGKTGADGRLRVDVRDPQSNFDGPQDYLLWAQVTDAADETISKRTAITAHVSDFYLGLHSQECVQAVGMPFSVNAVALSPDGKRVAAKALLSLIRQDTECTYTNDGYRQYPHCTTVQKPVWSKQVDVSATGVVTERIMPKYAGEYVIRLEGTDARGNKVAASDWVWILGKGEAFWSGDESARMGLIASKQLYAPGETARLVPRTDLTDATALVTLERNGIIDAFVKPMASASQGIEVRLDEAHVPNVYASVAMVSGRHGPGDKNRPRFKMGVANLAVKSDHNRLKVEVTTDKPSYQPGEKVSGKITVTSNGQPVSAEVSLSVADEGVLQLIDYKTPDPMLTFYKSWGLGIDNATNWNRIARLNDPAVIDPDEGGDSGGEDEQRVRSRFVSSAYWQPALVSDGKGEIAFSFTAPDNLTAFRLMAVAADEATRFGSGDLRMTVKKPLLAKPVLPRFLTLGDDAEVGVTVHNYTDVAGTATVTARAVGATLSENRATVQLDRDGSARVRFHARAGTAESARFTFSVSMGKHSDALAVTVPISRGRIIDTATLAAGQLGGVNHSATVPLTWAPTVLEDESTLSITVDRTGLAELEPGMRYLVEYPYGCLEQTLSRFLPLAVVRDLAGALDSKALAGTKADQFIKAGAAKVVRHQHSDGHYSLWPSGPTYPHLTVYATYGLIEARRAGVTVDEQAVSRGIEAIRRWANDGTRKLGPDGDSATVAMAAYLLAETGKPDHGLDARLYEARRGLPRYGLAFLLRALKLAKEPAAQIRDVESELLSAARPSAQGVIVVETAPELEWYMSSDVRSTAMALAALIEVDPQNPVIDRLADGLKSQRSGGGMWRNTEDNVWALIALADYARRQSAGSSTFTIDIGGKKVDKTLQGNAIFALHQKLSDVPPGKLTITTGDRIRYAVRVTSAREDKNVAAVDRGFSVTRAYLDAKTGKPVTSFTTGQLIKVQVTVKSPVDRGFVAVVDHLPAGFEAVNTRLATSQQQVNRGYGYGYHSWSWWWGWTHQELRDDRVLGFADRMQRGELVLEYLARVSLPGTYRTLPATAEAMYQPELNGRSATQSITIK